MRYFPISIDTRDKNILVLGGGDLASSKIQILLKTEFQIYCISNDFTEEILSFKEEYPDRLMLKGRSLSEEFVFFGYDFCLIATDDAKLNQALTDRAQKSQIAYYRADNIGDSNFVFNDVIDHYGLAVSMLSDGIGETVRKQIMKDIENVLFKYDIEKLTLLNQIRRQLILKNFPNVSEEIERLSKQNVAVIKAYLETLDRSSPDIVKEFVESDDNDKDQEDPEDREDSSESLEEENSSDEDE